MSGKYYYNVGYHTLETKRCLNYCVLWRLHLRNQQALSRNPNYTAYMEQLNLKLKVITDTVKVAEQICQDANKSRLDNRTPLTTFHQGQKVLYFQLPV